MLLKKIENVGVAARETRTREINKKSVVAPLKLNEGNKLMKSLAPPLMAAALLALSPTH